MKVIIYQYTEAPLELDQVVAMHIQNEDEISLTDAAQGRLDFSIQDILKMEIMGEEHGH